VDGERPDGFDRRWSALHGGLPPAGLVGRWLRLVRPVAELLRGVPPLVLTGAGLLVGWLAVWPAAAGWPLPAAAAVLLAAGFDALDGAVAVLAGRETRFGALADAVADRLTEVAHGVALWLAGAPGWLCAAAVGVGWLHEYVRERAAAGVLAVTVSERPTRVLFAFFGLVAAGTVGGPGLVGWAAVGWAAAAWLVVAVVGLGQLCLAAGRAVLSDPGPGSVRVPDRAD
jgi:CDP-diacylglycerol--glycerol-3-phosphate 3-phosphatidyltransferase